VDPAYWADVLQQRQTDYLVDAGAANELDFLSLRSFVVQALGDAAAYQHVRQPNATYKQIHSRIRDAVHRVSAHVLDGNPVPLIVLAHSLGSHIISSYVWDSQHGSATGADPHGTSFERMEWLAGMVTFGSTIPLFTFAFDPAVAVSFPGSALPDEIGVSASPASHGAYWTDNDFTRPVAELIASFI